MQIIVINTHLATIMTDPKSTDTKSKGNKSTDTTPTKKASVTNKTSVTKNEPVKKKTTVASRKTDNKKTVNPKATSTEQNISSNKPEPSVISKASAEPSHPESAQRPMTDQVTKQSNSAAIFAIIFSLAALAGVAFTWYQDQVVSVRSESGLAVGITEIGGQVSRIGDSVNRLQEQQTKVVSEDKLNASLEQTTSALDKKLEQFEEKFEEVDTAQAQLLESVTTLNNDIKSGSNAYVVDEVSQLLKLANNSLVFSADPDSALNALTVAASQLKSITDPRYSVVRVKVAEEIALLKNLETVDVEGISASLNAIAANVSSLPLENEPEATALVITNDIEQESGWRAELAELWTEIKSSIQVQQVEQAPKPLLAPDQRYFLDQNLQLMLAKADLALLQERDAIFQQSIDAASKWLLDYFDTDNAEVTNVIAQLNELRSQKTSVTLPTITGSFEALQAIRGGQ